MERGSDAGFLRKVRLFLTLTKPRQLALLMVTMYGAYFAAGGPLDPVKLSLLTVMGFTSIGAVTALNMYLDVDVDSVMRRTRRRPLPSGALSPEEALIGIIVLLVVGVVSAAAINEWVLVTVLAGLYFDIIAYTELTKRFTALNIVFGGIAGSMPALGGWAAGAGSITLGGILLALVVFLWQPMHVWFLGYYFKRDYEAAGIPVLPGGGDVRILSLLVALSLLGFIAITWLYALTHGYGYLTAILTTALSLASLARIGGFLRTGDRIEALRLFKLATPIIAVVFFLLPVEYYATLGAALQP